MPNMANVAGELIRQAIAAEVRAELARQNISVPKLAAMLGKDRTTMWQMARGMKAFRAEELALTAEFLGVPVSQLMPTATPEEAVA